MKPFMLVNGAAFAGACALIAAGYPQLFWAPIAALLVGGFMAVSALCNLVTSHLECSEKTGTKTALQIITGLIYFDGRGPVMPSLIRTSVPAKKPDLYQAPQFKALVECIKLLGPVACLPACLYHARDVK